MAMISFQFSKSAGRRDQDRLLTRLKKVAGVRAVGRIDEESPDADISRMCFAETIDDSVPKIVEQLHQASGIESVSVEPRRELIQ